MMKLIRIIAALCATPMLSGCAALQQIDVYNAEAEPYTSLTDEDLHSRECRINFSDEVTVNGQGAWLSGNEIQISEGGVYIITGTCGDSWINVKTGDAVKLVFNDADISNPDGFAVKSSSGKLIIGCETGNSKLTGCGGDYLTAVYSEGSVLFVGSGSLALDGGVFSEGGIRFSPAVSTFCEVFDTGTGDLIAGTLNIN